MSRSSRGTAAPTEGEWGPTVQGGRPRRGGRVLRWTLVVLSVLVLVAVGTGAALVLYASSQIERVPVEGLGSRGGPLQVLVVGSDSREGLTEDERRELTTGSAGGDRTDTIFLMTVQGGRVGLLAFPRDLFVVRCDGSEGRINAAMSIGGPSCLAETVSTVSGISIDHYMSVHFLGFRDIVDAVGGVRVCLDSPIQDRSAGIDLPAGCQMLNGTDALGYVRVRKIDNDLERIKRQQQFLRSLATEVVSPSTIVNVPRLFRTGGQIGGALTADEGLGPIDLVRLGFGMRGLATGAYVTHTVPVQGTTIGGASVLLPVEEEAQSLFRAFRDGSILAGAGESAPAPEDVAVAVLNGAGVAGLAGETADALEAQGFTVTDIGNADPVDRTVIRYPPVAKAEAEVLSRALPGDVPLEEAPEISTVTLVLGPDAVESG